MILYIENSKDTTSELLELINEYSKVARYKFSTQKSFLLLEIKETNPFTFEMKRIKYLRINLPKETKHLCIEKYKTLVKEGTPVLFLTLEEMVSIFHH